MITSMNQNSPNHSVNNHFTYQLTLGWPGPTTASWKPQLWHPCALACRISVAVGTLAPQKSHMAAAAVPAVLAAVGWCWLLLSVAGCCCCCRLLLLVATDVTIAVDHLIIGGCHVVTAYRYLWLLSPLTTRWVISYRVDWPATHIVIMHDTKMRVLNERYPYPVSLQ